MSEWNHNWICICEVHSEKYAGHGNNNNNNNNLFNFDKETLCVCIKFQEIFIFFFKEAYLFVISTMLTDKK